MEFSITLVFAASLVVLGLKWACQALNLVWLTPRKLERLLRQQGLSGNPYRFPYGDLLDLYKMRSEARSKLATDFSNDMLSRVEPFLHHTIKIHGKNSFTWFGPTPAVIVSDPDAVREVLSRVMDFTKPNFSLAELLIPGLASANGEKWVKHRKLMNPAFHMEKLKLMLPAFHTSCNEMINTWKKMVPETGSVELDVWPHLVNLTSDIISRAAFSSSYAEGKEAFELIEEQSQVLYRTMKASFVPGWRYVPTKANRRFNKVQKEIQNIIRGIVDTRMKVVEAGEETKNDLLGLLVESSFKEMQHQGSRETRLGMTIDEVIDECKLFYFAGQETTSAFLAFTMILLSKYTNWQEKARQEILQTFGKNKPDANGISHLKIVTMILHEVLRLYPPNPSTYREVKADTKLGKLSLPAGAYVHLPIMLSHLDADPWGEDATEFKPERFSEGVSKATNGKNMFLPFGMGPRICIGNNFALTEVKVALAMILQYFSFELSPSYAHAPYLAITMRPQYGAHIVLRRL